ncbi:Hpt domain-containing protein [uncultured Citricoccus sp.]|uniref:Hpt domain-containing protein n=1 Tax=uncultured Citricoccus sp. TaxID=614031 RepID=UPI002601F2DF|nr:Hpt domain-containing protein [uncultured Citricoccus sp.]
MPILDTDVLIELVEELGDGPPTWGFLARYMQLLDHRVDRLDRALITRDAEGWLDAVQSLKVSSAMAGATALSAAAAQLQERIAPIPPDDQRWPTGQQRTEIITGLRQLAQETRHHLHLFLHRPILPVTDTSRESRGT